ncbi:MAG TPA: hypothetical protein VJ801_14655 [Polyangia bacterium]|nr:hypothetical protein [Polyangia bacterium]
MLDHLRAASRYQGKRPRNWRDLFAEETQAIRLAVKAAASRARVAVDYEARASISVSILGHHRHDPDGWYLWAKAAIDGLADADAIDCDRRNVGRVSGYVCQSKADEAACPSAAIGPGGLVVVTWEIP